MVKSCYLTYYFRTCKKCYSLLITNVSNSNISSLLLKSVTQSFIVQVSSKLRMTCNPLGTKFLPLQIYFVSRVLIIHYNHFLGLKILFCFGPKSQLRLDVTTTVEGMSFTSFAIILETDKNVLPDSYTCSIYY